MFLLIASFFALTLPSNTVAQSECVIKEGIIQFESDITGQCQNTGLEGPYKWKICDNKLGQFIGNDGVARVTFPTSLGWMSKRQAFDFSDQTDETEMLAIDFNKENLTFLKTKTNSNGKVLSQVKCETVKAREGGYIPIVFGNSLSELGKRSCTAKGSFCGIPLAPDCCPGLVCNSHMHCAKTFF